MPKRSNLVLILAVTVSLVSLLTAGEPPSERTATVFAAATPLAGDAVVEDWPYFLGPRYDGVSKETKLNLAWGAEGPKLLWSLPRGSGYASPAIAQGKLVYQHRLGDANIIECLDPLTGARLWQRSLPVAYKDRYGYNDGPRSSPVIDADQVLVYSQIGVLRALTLATGEERWSRDLSSDYAVLPNFFGVGTTPLVFDDKIIINVGGPQGPEVVALDRSTGKTVWTAGDQWGASYATAVPGTVQQKKRVFIFAGGESRPATGGLLSLDPATGALDFRFPWRSTSYESVNASCPVVIGNQVLVTASYQTGAALLTIGPDMQPTTAWTSDAFAVHFATPIYADGYLYSFAGRNHPDVEMACVELATGKTMWSEQPQWKDTLTQNGSSREVTMSVFRGQFVLAEGKFICLGEEGHLVCYDLSPTGYKELHRAWVIKASETWTPPVLSHGLLYLCQNKRGHDGSPARLLCYDLRGQ
jgi:outer membrane protein assembly factor BamB